MKRLVVTALAAALLVAAVVPAAPAQPAPSKAEFGDYWVVLAGRGPNWKPQTTEAGAQAPLDVIAGLQKAFTNGEIITAGLVTDGSGVEFIILIESSDAGTMRQKLENAKHVKDGFYKLTIHDWRAPKGLKLVPVPLQK